jgi:hypothetical protein
MHEQKAATRDVVDGKRAGGGGQRGGHHVIVEVTLCVPLGSFVSRVMEEFPSIGWGYFF